MIKRNKHPASREDRLRINEEKKIKRLSQKKKESRNVAEDSFKEVSD